MADYIYRVATLDEGDEGPDYDTCPDLETAQLTVEYLERHAWPLYDDVWIERAVAPVWERI